MNLSIKGILLHYGQVNTFECYPIIKKRSFRIQTFSEYPQLLTFDLYDDNVDKILKIPLKTNIIVYFELKGKIWIDKEGNKRNINTYTCYAIKTY